MKRARYLALLLVATLTGCADPGPGGSGGTDRADQVVVLPAGQPQLMAELSFTGGYVPASWPVIEAPRLAVYSDGRAVADVGRTLTLTLTRDELVGLVGALRRELAGLPTAVQARGRDEVYDAGSTVMVVRTAAGALQSVGAYAMGLLEYPPAVVAASDRLKGLAERIDREGTRFTAERIRLVAEERTRAPSAGAAPWPAAVAVPPPHRSQSRVRVANLSGAAVAAVTRSLPRDDRRHNWPVRRTDDGLVLAAAWRYLLPHE